MIGNGDEVSRGRTAWLKRSEDGRRRRGEPKRRFKLRRKEREEGEGGGDRRAASMEMGKRFPPFQKRRGLVSEIANGKGHRVKRRRLWPHSENWLGPGSVQPSENRPVRRFRSGFHFGRSKV
ncbi:hypothetical protein PIB30_083845 [Stylosanthes scabra]|uniref:Uncharacterized protein n=1 Tax=Stylosanthes scabra TaxID=79078 RepID=A0ABU6TUB7_9FABA|nr:hypothetical protein [Stylosanthes scabra]